MIATRRKSSGAQRSSTITIPAPVKGWDAKNGLADMDIRSAVTLQNWWPASGTVNVRNGFTNHVTGITGQVESLMTYSSASANTMFGAAGTAIYNVTAAGAVGAASVSGKTNARWQHVNFTVSGTNSYLLAVNGADKMIAWTGSAWAKDGDGAPYDVTNVNTAACSNICVFKTRIWLIENASLKAWYLPVNQIGGAATALDMSGLCEFGGYIMAAQAWTVDGGYGLDDYLAFITSQGEVLVWRLTDPATVTGILLIGVFQIGAPIGRRCMMKYGGDLLIITEDGVVPMSEAIRSSRTTPGISITDQIQYAVNQAVLNYGATFGWQLIDFAKGNQLYLNVPVAVGSQQQYVQNNITKAWCNFTGWAANCWESLNDNLYFGANGVVCRAWNGTTDAGASIPTFALQSFQTYGTPAQKQVKMIRFHLQTDGAPSIYGNVNVDYNLADTSAQLSSGSGGSAGLWDAGVWDAAVWGSGLTPSAEWQGATGIGYSFAPILKTATNGIQLQWAATDIVLEGGGVL